MTPGFQRVRSARLLATLLAVSVACAPGPSTGTGADSSGLPEAPVPDAASDSDAAGGSAPPARLLGAFEDDYGNSYDITPASWVQLPHGRFHIRAWNAAGRFLVAQNDSLNAHAPGLWTRIDWVPLEGMQPYEWAYCLSEYEAASRADAEQSTVARRDSLRTGCNGYPFSRMRPVSEPASRAP